MRLTILLSLAILALPVMAAEVPDALATAKAEPERGNGSVLASGRDDVAADGSGVMKLLPPFEQWKPSNGIRVEGKPDQPMIVGDNSQGGYQFISPVFPIGGKQRVTIQIDYRTSQGRVCPGVLTSDASTWIVSPGQSRNKITFVSGADDSGAIVVLANCNEEAIGSAPSRFVLESAKYKTETISTNEKKTLLSKEEIALTLGISAKAPRLEMIHAARSFVYLRAGNNPVPQTNSSNEDLYLLAVKNKLPRSCGEMARAYQYVLDRFGISSRRVGLHAKSYVEGVNTFDTHYTIEAELENGRFIASDPTFNASFRCKGAAGLASYEELYQCIARGRKVTPVLGVQLPNWGINDYYIPYAKLFAGVVIYAKGKNGDLNVELPKGWVRSREEALRTKAAQ